MVVFKGANIQIFLRSSYGKRKNSCQVADFDYFCCPINTKRRMGFFLRLILTGLGWSFGGPLGAIIGYAIGGLFSSNRPRIIRSEVNETFGNTEEKRDFNVTRCRH